MREGGDMYDEHIKFIEWTMAYDAGDIKYEKYEIA